MRIQTTLILALALVAVSGCTSTPVFDLSDPFDQQAIAKKESVRLDLVDGAEIVGYAVQVGVDSLVFRVERLSQQRDTVAVSKIAKGIDRQINPVKTAALVIGIPVDTIIGVGILYVVACATSGEECD